MGALGAGNPFGFELGGGPSRVEQTNSALKSAVGVGGSAPDGTMEAQWRFAKARGWTASVSDGRAMYQTWPNTSDEGGIEVFEEVLHITPPSDATLEERRQVALTRWIRIVSAATPNLIAGLELIDPSIKISNPTDRDTVTTTIPGRAFEDADPTSPEANGPKFFQYGSQKHTFFANYSQDFIVFVAFPIPPGPIPKTQQFKIFLIQALLDEALPSWCQFQIFTNLVGGVPACFILDTDRLDISALCS